MNIHISSQGLITAAAVLAACIAIGGTVFKIYDWYKKQSDQEKEFADIRRIHTEDIRSVKEEQTLIVYGVLACLKGLSEQGCNGPVTKAIDKLEKHLNIEAHK